MRSARSASATKPISMVASSRAAVGSEKENQAL
jgi:hypothetical protein